MEETIQPLDPIAIALGPVQIHWYGVIIGVGIALALWIAMREADKRGLHKDTFPDLMLWAIPAAIICARIYYVIFQWDYYSQNPGDIPEDLEWRHCHSRSFNRFRYNGLYFCKKKNISFWKLADIAAPSIILGQAIGRWGNFMNQEAYGNEVTRAFLENLYLPDFIVNQMFINGAYYHPTFLYESIWNIIGFFLLLALRRVNLGRGEIFLSYIIWYSIGRFFVEGLRTDSLMLTETLRMAQTISIGLIILAIVLFVVRRKNGYTKVHYLDNNK